MYRRSNRDLSVIHVKLAIIGKIAVISATWAVRLEQETDIGCICPMVQHQNSLTLSVAERITEAPVERELHSTLQQFIKH